MDQGKRSGNRNCKDVELFDAVDKYLDDFEGDVVGA
jgi:hypothetical protein